MIIMAQMERIIADPNKEGMGEQPTQDRFLFYKKYPHLPFNVTEP
jgi:hypothetical protein